MRNYLATIFLTVGFLLSVGRPSQAVQQGPRDDSVRPDESLQTVPGSGAAPDQQRPNDTKRPKRTGDDPTAPSDRMKQLLLPAKPGTPGAPPAAKQPGMSLRGRVFAKDRPPVALIEIDGKRYVVTKGSVLHGPADVEYRVLEVSVLEVRLEASPLKEVFVLH